MKRLKKLGVLCVLTAVAALSFGSVTASAVPPEQALPQSCHGFVVSSVATETSGLGTLGDPSHGELGRDQQELRDLCKQFTGGGGGA